MKKILIVGAGLSGSVLAEQLSKSRDAFVHVIDERDHIGGNCFTSTDHLTGITEHVYGPHIFNTDDRHIWDYMNRFCTMVPFTNRVKAVYHNEVYSIPVNLHTINQFFRKALDPREARKFIDELGDKNIGEPANFEEQALKMIGKDLYQAFFYSYTKKQWGCEPSMLPASVLKRLPVRFNYNDNYYENRFQGIPKEGYTPIFGKMLDSPAIKVELKTKFEASAHTQDYDHIFYTGRIDGFFGYKFGMLGYRTVYFEKNYAEGDFQGNAVINYTDDSVPFTRIHEHKHFTPWQNFDKTLYFREFSRETEETDIPFYPKRLPGDLQKLRMYQAEAAKLAGYTFLGRLGTYRYIDMQHVIAEALSVAKNFMEGVN